ncbi:MAG: glycosyltransferase family 39 protein [Dehalococcoidia bacterium]|nr:glycosyltransferase family 39 protein [Dehalococcoidia bacterium]
MMNFPNSSVGKTAPEAVGTGGRRRYWGQVWHHPLRNIIIIGLAIRMAIALATAWPDTEAFSLLGLRTLVSPGAGAPFDNIYPATWITIISLSLGGAGFFQDPLNMITPLPGGAYDLGQVGLPLTNILSWQAALALKLPCILMDMLTGLVIYGIVKELANETKAKLAFKLWVFNPLVITVSCALGMYDVFAGFFSLLAVYLVTRRSFWSAGMAFTLGFLFKPHGLFLGIGLGIFILAFGFANGRTAVANDCSPVQRGVKSLGKKLMPLGQFAAGCLFPVAVFLPGGMLLGIGSDISTRLTWNQLGGINPWFIQLIPWDAMQSIFAWGHGHFPLVLMASMALGGMSTLLVALLALRKMHFSTKGIYLVAFVSMALYPILTPYNGAHYFVPCIAFLVVVVTVFDLSMTAFHTLSMSLFAWILSLWGAAFLWLPLAINWNLFSSEDLIERTFNYMAKPGWLNDAAYLDVRLFCVIAIFVSLLWLVITTIRSIYQRDDQVAFHKRRQQQLAAAMIQEGGK